MGSMTNVTFMGAAQQVQASSAIISIANLRDVKGNKMINMVTLSLRNRDSGSDLLDPNFGKFWRTPS